MRRLAVSLGALLVCAAPYACGGRTAHTVTIPINHRATPTACTPQAISTVACSDTSGAPACTSSSECTAGLDGSCDLFGVCTCTYDACLSDGDCGSDTSSACDCDAAPGGAGSTGSPMRCVAANCRVDSDCGPAGYCSPSVSGGCGTVAGVFCHTTDDECGNDSDCAAPTNACMYLPELGHWACGFRSGCGG